MSYYYKHSEGDSATRPRIHNRRACLVAARLLNIDLTDASQWTHNHLVAAPRNGPWMCEVCGKPIPKNRVPRTAKVLA